MHVVVWLVVSSEEEEELPAEARCMAGTHKNNVVRENARTPAATRPYCTVATSYKKLQATINTRTCLVSVVHL